MLSCMQCDVCSVAYAVQWKASKGSRKRLRVRFRICVSFRVILALV